MKLDYHHSVTVTGITHSVKIPTFSNVGLSPSTSPWALTNYMGQPSNVAVEKPADSTLLLTSPAMSQTESKAPHTPCGSQQRHVGHTASAGSVPEENARPNSNCTEASTKHKLQAVPENKGLQVKTVCSLFLLKKEEEGGGGGEGKIISSRQNIKAT